MENRILDRVGHIRRACALIRDLLSGRSRDDVERDPLARAAFERLPEIVSEASRHIPDTWKAAHPSVPWRNIRDLSNVIRHAYDGVDFDTLWEIYQSDLDPLEAALDQMTAGTSGRNTSS